MNLNRSKLVFLGVFFLFSFNQCAQTIHKPLDYRVSTENETQDVKDSRARKNSLVNGVRYYAPTTYILMVPDATKNKPDIKIYIGPDTSRIFVADPFAFMATNNETLGFEYGVLKKSTSVVDTSAVVASFITQAQSLITKAMDIAAEKAKMAAATAMKAAAMAVNPSVPFVPVYLFKVKPNGVICQIELGKSEYPTAGIAMSCK